MAVNTNGLQCFGHDLWTVVDGQNNVRNASRSQCFDLVLDHGLVRELNEWLWVCKGLQRVSVLRMYSNERGCLEQAVRKEVDVREVADGFQTLRQE
jgi:hypothetical protein